MENFRLFKCPHCGKVIELLPGTHGCPTKCCGESMVELSANTSDGAKEKHVPAVSVEDNKVLVQVGSVAHPMLDNHFITFITLVTNKETRRVDLHPGDAPAYEFTLGEDEKPIEVYEYCNLHGLWVYKF